MTSISIIGTGNMGQAIASVAGKGGATVQLIGEGDAGTQVTGDVVVLAVPYPALSAVIAERGASLAGKIVERQRERERSLSHPRSQHAPSHRNDPPSSPVEFCCSRKKTEVRSLTF